jgi:hypothetical protein
MEIISNYFALVPFAPRPPFVMVFGFSTSDEQGSVPAQNPTYIYVLTVLVAIYITKVQYTLVCTSRDAKKIIEITVRCSFRSRRDGFPCPSHESSIHLQ